jgi:hypothetical protein
VTTAGATPGDPVTAADAPRLTDDAGDAEDGVAGRGVRRPGVASAVRSDGGGHVRFRRVGRELRGSRLGLAVLIALHGLVHVLGAARAFGWAGSGSASVPISSAAGALWLAAAALLIVAATAMALGLRWWYVGLPGVVLSQALIVSAWDDARLGTIVNLVIAVALLATALDSRPGSFRSQFRRDHAALLARPVRPAPIVTDEDLAALPPLLQTYLRRVGAVGRPRVRNVRIVFDAWMRSTATSPWMRASATQYEFFDPPARLFSMHATRSGVPFDVLHRYVGGAATFRVRIAGLVPVVDKQGPGITHDETVTLMNDVLVLAPAAVLDLPFVFETLGERTLRATFRNACFTVAAVITFDAAGDLVGFVSGDRTHDREEGRAEWSTPISGYRIVDGIRIGARGDANWVEPPGEWTYGRFEIASIAYNVAR